MAGDRIGGGPWYNAKGVVVARGPMDLHTVGLRPDAVLTVLTKSNARLGLIFLDVKRAVQTAKSSARA